MAVTQHYLFDVTCYDLDNKVLAKFYVAGYSPTEAKQKVREYISGRPALRAVFGHVEAKHVRRLDHATTVMV